MKDGLAFAGKLNLETRNAGGSSVCVPGCANECRPPTPEPVPFELFVKASDKSTRNLPTGSAFEIPPAPLPAGPFHPDASVEKAGEDGARVVSSGFMTPDGRCA